MAKVFTLTEGLEHLGALREGGEGSVYKARTLANCHKVAVRLSIPKRFGLIETATPFDLPYLKSITI